MEEFRFLINEEQEDERIDKYINGLIDSLSRSYIQKLITDKQVLVNEMPVKANYRLKCDDSILCGFPKP